jgi:hypothetical protein
VGGGKGQQTAAHDEDQELIDASATLSVAAAVPPLPWPPCRPPPSPLSAATAAAALAAACASACAFIAAANFA